MGFGNRDLGTDLRLAQAPGALPEVPGAERLPLATASDAKSEEEPKATVAEISQWVIEGCHYFLGIHFCFWEHRTKSISPQVGLEGFFSIACRVSSIPRGAGVL